MLSGDRTKVSQLSDKLELEKAQGLFLTETWLHSDIMDAEIHIPGYSLFRCDRSQRQRGGTAAYFKENLGCIPCFQYCDTKIEILLVKCKKMDSIFECYLQTS